MQNTVYLNHSPNEKWHKKGIELYLENAEPIDVILAGEIYNAREICDILMVDYISPEHTIKSVYEAYGIEETVRILDGNYTFVLIDHNNLSDTAVYIARDIIGIYPIYIHTIPIGHAANILMNPPTNQPFILKRLDIIDGINQDNLYDRFVISSQQVVEGAITRTCNQGSYSHFSLPFCVNAKWKWEGETRISALAIMPLVSNTVPLFDYYSRTLQQIFEQSVEKRIRYADIVVCIANDSYGTYMAKIARELCVLSNREFILMTDAASVDPSYEKNTVTLHTGNIENLFHSAGMNPIVENRVLRNHIENHNLYDILRKGDRGLQYPYWDIIWIQFYMTMPAKYRDSMKEIFLVEE